MDNWQLRLIRLPWLRFRNVIHGWLCLASGLATFGGMFAGTAILGLEIQDWLQFGDWPDWPLLQVFYYFDIEPPIIDWVGLHKIVYWILESPAWAVCLGVGIALAVPTLACVHRKGRRAYAVAAAERFIASGVGEEDKRARRRYGE